MANLGVRLKLLDARCALKKEDRLFRLVIFRVILAEEEKSIPIQGILPENLLQYGRGLLGLSLGGGNLGLQL